jgi:hypothetical protein
MHVEKKLCEKLSILCQKLYKAQLIQGRGVFRQLSKINSYYDTLSLYLNNMKNLSIKSLKLVTRKSIILCLMDYEISSLVYFQVLARIMTGKAVIKT